MDPKADRRTVAALGQGTRLVVVIVQRWPGFDEVRRRADDLARFDLARIEETLPPDDVEGLSGSAASVPTRIAGGEALSTVAEFERFLVGTRPAVVQPDVTRCGRISR